MSARWHVDSRGVVADRAHYWLTFEDEGSTLDEHAEFARRHLSVSRLTGWEQP